MLQIILRRFANTPDGVFGKLYLPGQPFLFTVEEDWRDNKRGVSSIPAGTYRIRRYRSPKHGYDVFMLLDVPGRSYIEIHPANTEEDIEGCIGLGLRMGWLTVDDEDAPGPEKVSKRAVLDSQKAFKRFMYYMAGIKEAELVVEWAPGVQK